MISNEQLFLKVVEAGSFKRAAEYLHMEPSSVSRRISALEKRLKVKLLRRSTVRTTATELGRHYYQRLSRLFDEQLALEDEISSGVHCLRGHMRIAAPVEFGACFVVPVVRQMQRQASELSVELLLGSQFENMLEQNLDVAVRIGELADSSLIAKPVGQNERVLVASPGYLAGHGMPEVPEQLAAHHFILYSPGQGRSDIVFADGSRFPSARIHSTMTVNSVTAVRNLVLEDVGIHLGPKWVFKADIERGDVVQLLPDKALQSFPINAVYPSKDYLPLKTREFVRLLSEYLNP